jgi:hypothetical protein
VILPLHPWEEAQRRLREVDPFRRAIISDSSPAAVEGEILRVAERGFAAIIAGRYGLPLYFIR